MRQAERDVLGLQFPSIHSTIVSIIAFLLLSFVGDRVIMKEMDEQVKGHLIHVNLCQ